MDDSNPVQFLLVCNSNTPMQGLPALITQTYNSIKQLTINKDITEYMIIRNSKGFFVPYMLTVGDCFDKDDLIECVVLPTALMKRKNNNVKQRNDAVNQSKRQKFELDVSEKNTVKEGEEASEYESDSEERQELAEPASVVKHVEQSGSEIDNSEEVGLVEPVAVEPKPKEAESEYETDSSEEDEQVGIKPVDTVVESEYETDSSEEDEQVEVKRVDTIVESEYETGSEDDESNDKPVEEHVSVVEPLKQKVESEYETDSDDEQDIAVESVIVPVEQNEISEYETDSDDEHDIAVESVIVPVEQNEISEYETDSDDEQDKSVETMVMPVEQTAESEYETDSDDEQDIAVESVIVPVEQNEISEYETDSDDEQDKKVETMIMPVEQTVESEYETDSDDEQDTAVESVVVPVEQNELSEYETDSDNEQDKAVERVVIPVEQKDMSENEDNVAENAVEQVEASESDNEGEEIAVEEFVNANRDEKRVNPEVVSEYEKSPDEEDDGKEAKSTEGNENEIYSSGEEEEVYEIVTDFNETTDQMAMEVFVEGEESSEEEYEVVSYQYKRGVIEESSEDEIDQFQNSALDQIEEPVFDSVIPSSLPIVETKNDGHEVDSDNTLDKIAQPDANYGSEGEQTTVSESEDYIEHNLRIEHNLPNGKKISVPNLNITTRSRQSQSRKELQITESQIMDSLPDSVKSMSQNAQNPLSYQFTQPTQDSKTIMSLPKSDLDFSLFPSQSSPVKKGGSQESELTQIKPNIISKTNDMQDTQQDTPMFESDGFDGDHQSDCTTQSLTTQKTQPILKRTKDTIKNRQSLTQSINFTSVQKALKLPKPLPLLLRPQRKTRQFQKLSQITNSPPIIVKEVDENSSSTDSSDSSSESSDGENGVRRIRKRRKSMLDKLKKEGIILLI
jgi:hypothetical protein